jgi:hypothetical protein
MTPTTRDTTRPTATRRKPPIRRAPTVPERTLLHALADVLAAIAGRAGTEAAAAAAGAEYRVWTGWVEHAREDGPVVLAALVLAAAREPDPRMRR